MLPYAIPTSTAAKIAGISARTFRQRVIQPGLVERDGRRVVLSSLAAYLGRDIDAGTYLAADRRRDAAREYQRDYRRNH